MLKRLDWITRFYEGLKMEYNHFIQEAKPLPIPFDSPLGILYGDGNKIFNFQF